jgi:DNA-binding NarL/FixJ family response regulator
LRIEILLGVMPRMLRDVVSEIFGAQEDMSILAEDVGVDELLERVDRERPDVVVLSVPSGTPPPVCGELLDRHPRLTLVALEDRGQRASIYMLRPMRFRLGGAEVSGAQLVTAIRRAAVPGPFLSSVYDVEAQLANLKRPAS